MHLLGLRGLNHTNTFSHRPGGWEAKVTAFAGFMTPWLAGGSLLNVSSRVVPLFTHTPGDAPSAHRTPLRWDEGLPTDLFKLHHLFKRVRTTGGTGGWDLSI